MTPTDLLHQRRWNQGIAAPSRSRVHEVVSHLGAMQGQDYPGVLWSIGLRLDSGGIEAVQRALSERIVVRSWPLRGTLHVTASEDLRWMLALSAPRVIARSALRYRQLELDASVFEAADRALSAVMQGGWARTRVEVNEALRKAGIDPAGQRSYHILHRLALDGRICFGPMKGKQHTFVLLDEWISPSMTLSREEALAELARRYFSSRGPASDRDFAWWAGLTLGDARAGMESVEASFAGAEMDGRKYLRPESDAGRPDEHPAVDLLPGFDEFMLGYTDRSAAVATAHARRLASSNGVFRPTLLVNGEVAGIWKARRTRSVLQIEPTLFRLLTPREWESMLHAADRYGRFLGVATVVED